MRDIEILEQSQQGEILRFVVAVRVGGGETRHRVTLSETDYHRLAGGLATPGELVIASFRFLLDREPKESILRSFDLPVIGHYFPEYERELHKLLTTTTRK